MTPTSHEVTKPLLAWSAGDKQALDRLVPLVHDELRRLAQSYMRKERADQTSQIMAAKIPLHPVLPRWRL